MFPLQVIMCAVDFELFMSLSVQICSLKEILMANTESCAAAIAANLKLNTRFHVTFLDF